MNSLKPNVTRRYAYRRVRLIVNNTMGHTRRDRHTHTRDKRTKTPHTFFYDKACTAQQPPGEIPTRPCDASRRLPRLPDCGRLGAASLAAAGAVARPQPPLHLLLLLLGCYCE